MAAHELPAAARLCLVGLDDAGRARFERHVRDCYARAYGAEVSHFLPTLIGLEGDGGNVLGVLGIRPAATGALFLEQYLDQPIERVLAARMGAGVERSAVVELGNLAAGSAGVARALIDALRSYVRDAGFDWLVFTAVPAVRNSFGRMGLRLVELAPAAGDRLGAELVRWGSYYEHRPVVVACNVMESCRRLERAERVGTAPRLRLPGGRIAGLRPMEACL